MFDEKFRKRLKAQKDAGLYRNPPEIENRNGRFLTCGGIKMLNFASNDYLGFGSSETVGEMVAECFRKYGASSSSSRLVTGNFSAIRQAEKAYADYFGYEDAIFFPSGFQANLALLSTLFDKGDRIHFDKHVHASSVKGISLSGADFKGYRHNNLTHLEKRLSAENSAKSTVVTEGLFSMDGDSPDFEAIQALKDRYGFFLIVDEAHSFGALGNKGKGLSGGVADIGIGTFGKAFGLFGAFILLPSLVREYLVNFSAPYIYTTSLPEAHGVAAEKMLHIIENAGDAREKLLENSHYMKQSLQGAGFKVAGDAQVLAIEIGEEARTATVAQNLRENGIFAFPARFPTVPLGRAIIRISMTSMHTKEDVDLFCRQLMNVKTGV